MIPPRTIATIGSVKELRHLVDHIEVLVFPHAVEFAAVLIVPLLVHNISSKYQVEGFGIVVHRQPVDGVANTHDPAIINKTCNPPKRQQERQANAKPP